MRARAFPEVFIQATAAQTDPWQVAAARWSESKSATTFSLMPACSASSAGLNVRRDVLPFHFRLESAQAGQVERLGDPPIESALDARLEHDEALAYDRLGDAVRLREPRRQGLEVLWRIRHLNFFVVRRLDEALRGASPLLCFCSCCLRPQFVPGGTCDNVSDSCDVLGSDCAAILIQRRKN